MNEFKKHQKMFKLGGESLLAAKKIFATEQSYLRRNPIHFEGRNMGDIGKDFDAAHQAVTGMLRQKYPELLEALGLDQPSTRVVDTYGHFKRAYAVFPSLWVSEVDGSIYMYSQADYKGYFFTPKDAIELTREEEEKAGEKLFMGGWGSPAPVLPQKEAAAAIPKDFDPSKHIVFKNDPLLRSHGPREHRFFKVMKGGKTALDIYDFQNAGDFRSKSFSNLVDHITQNFNDIVKSNNVVNADTNKEYSAGYSMSQNPKDASPVIEIMLQKHFIDPDDISASFSRKGDYFDTKIERNCTILVPHERTEEARKISKLFNAITQQPSLYDYPDLIYPEVIKPSDDIDAMIRGDGCEPIIRELGDDIYLEYRVNAGKKLNFLPEDTKEVSEAYYLWMRENDEDAKKGYSLPNMPHHLRVEDVETNTPPSFRP